MAITKIADIVIPQPFAEGVLEPSIYPSRFVQSGAVTMSSQLDAFLAGGGKTLNDTFWQDVSHADSGVPSETVATVADKATQATQTAVRLMRVKDWGYNKLSGILSGSDPLGALSSRVGGFWTQDYDKIIIKTIEGIRLDNVANDSSDLQIGDGTGLLSTDLVVDAQGLLGDKGGADAFAIMVVHPKVRDFLRKQDALTTVKESQNALAIDYYMGMELIVDGNMPVPVAGQYVSYLVKRGSILFGQSSVGYEPVSTSTIETLGMGEEYLHTRRNFAMHPNGFSFVGTPAGVAPTNTELATATSWNRVYNKENSGLAFIYADLA